MVGVRDADVRGCWSPSLENAEEAAALARELDVGDARAFPSIEAMAADPAVDAIWLCGPNHTRIENLEAIVSAVRTGAALRGVACEKPLARTVAEAKRMRALVAEAGLPHGYLENQIFAPGVARGRELLWRRGAALTGRPYLARAAEEHGGPHRPWFWRGDLQGGGVLNDMACHSVEVVRHLLTAPGAPRASIRPRQVTGRIASLKWTRPEYAARLRQAMGAEVDYRTRPAEDFASVTIEYEAEDGAHARRRGHHLVGLRRGGAAAEPGAARPRVLAVGQLARRRREALLQPRGAGRGGRGPRREAERRGRFHARRRRRGIRVRLHGREPPHGPGLPARRRRPT